MTAHKPAAMPPAAPSPPSTPSLPSPPAPTAPTAPPGKARLLYCKAHVAIHPTAFKRDNIPGYLGLVDVGEGVAATHGVAGEGLLVSWVPEQVLARMDAADREGYRRAGEMAAGEREEDGECAVAGGGLTSTGFVFVSVPPPQGEQYAFSVPATSIYSVLVYPVRTSLVHIHR